MAFIRFALALKIPETEHWTKTVSTITINKYTLSAKVSHFSNQLTGTLKIDNLTARFESTTLANKGL